VFFFDDINLDQVLDLGPKIEAHQMFPNRVNVEFVKILSSNEISMLVYERSVGITLACGTGACASVVAGVLKGVLERNSPVVVHLQGGDLTITYSETTVLMSGPATHVFDGYINNFKLVA